MKSPIHEASARQHFGEPFSGLSANDARRDRLHHQDLAGVRAQDGEIQARHFEPGNLMTGDRSNF